MGIGFFGCGGDVLLVCGFILFLVSGNKNGERERGAVRWIGVSCGVLSREIFFNSFGDVVVVL